jgi:hypothetical protein
MSFKDLIKNAIFEEEPGAKQQQPVRPVQHASSVAMPRPPHYEASETAPPVASDNQFYTRLAKQTDLSVVPELAKIESFAAPLNAVIPEKSLRYKAALATAQSQGGLTREAILKSFDKLLSVLDSSADTFGKQSDDMGKTDVDAKTAQINDLNSTIQQKQKEIADMQQQINSMQSAVEVSRSRLQQAKASFASAYARRKSEIEQQRKEFETILQ